MNERLWVLAASVLVFPGWSASMVQVPAVTKVSAPPLVMVHTLDVLLENATGRPELAVAPVVGDVPKFWAPGLMKLMLWLARGVTGNELPESAPVPAELVAVTVKV